MSELLSAIVRTLFRYFVTGHPLRGTPGDNATFLHAANADNRGKPYEKLSGPIWHRLARRWAVLGVPLLFLTLSALASAVQLLPSPDPAWTRVDWFHMAFRWWIIGGAVLAGYGIYRTVQAIRTRGVRQEFEEPTWEAACDAMSHRYRPADAPRMVQLPDDFKPADVEEGESSHSVLTRWWHLRQERRQQELESAWAQYEAAAEEDTSEPTSAELVPVEAGGVDIYRPPLLRNLIPRRPPPEDVLEEPVRIMLPPGKCATTAEKNRLLQKVGPILGMPDPKPSWDKRLRFVDLRPNHPPPPELTFAEVVPYLSKPGVDIEHPMIGMSHGRKVETIDFVNDSPHVLISAASGTGKTNLVKFILSQRMHMGAGLVVLDHKLISHRWAHNLPGCDYAWEIESTEEGRKGIHDLLVEIGDEIHERKRLSLPNGLDGDVEAPLTKFDTLDILVEEQNVLADQLRDYWAEIRTPNDPGQSPALAALRAAVYTGREFGVHVFSVAQQARADIFGASGGAARESFSTRIMADWTVNTWKMLAAGIPFARCPAGGRGIFARIQTTGEAKVAIVRVPMITNRQARDWAMSGVPSPRGSALRPASDEPVVEPVEVTLSEAVKWLPDVKTVGTLRQAAKRSGFPAPVGKGKQDANIYLLEDLRQWREGVKPRLTVRQIGNPDGRPGLVYRFDVFIDGVGRRLGYVGKTRRRIDLREEEHRGDKPWSDLIIGNAEVLWESDDCTEEKLDEMERHYIRELFPLFNYEYQEGAEHAVPKWTQLEERHARDDAAGRPQWKPRDVYAERAYHVPAPL